VAEPPQRGAVDEQQLRRVGELAGPLPALTDRTVALVEVGGQPAGEDLLHRRVVVVARDVDLEPAVLALVGQPVFEHDHRTDVVGPLQMRHVVALDPERRLRKRQQILQLGQRPGATVVIRRATDAVACELFAGVAGDGVEQGTLVASLRNPDLDM